jgi:hypothetical protein
MTELTSDAAIHIANFIKAMNAWEVATWRASRDARSSAEPASYLDVAATSLYEILLQFCTPTVSETQGQSAYGHPPEWDPSSETIACVNERPSDAEVETIRERRSLGGGRFRYRLVKTDTSWRIASLEKQTGDSWSPRTLPLTNLKRVPQHLRLASR